MRWTDEVHQERTLEARREAKHFSRGQDISAKGTTKVDYFLVAGVLLAALVQCENRGKIRVVRLPFIGPWASKQLLALRRRLADPFKSRSGGSHAKDAARSAALKRQAQSQMQAQRESQQSQQSQQSKKKSKGRRKR